VIDLKLESLVSAASSWGMLRGGRGLGLVLQLVLLWGILATPDQSAQTREIRELRSKNAALRKQAKGHCARERGYIQELLAGVHEDEQRDERLSQIGASLGLPKNNGAAADDIRRLLSPQGPKGEVEARRAMQAVLIKKEGTQVEVGESETNPLETDAVRNGVAIGKPIVDHILSKLVPKLDPLAATRELSSKAVQEGAWKPPKCEAHENEGCWCRFPDLCKAADRYPNKPGTCLKKLGGDNCKAQLKSGKCTKAAKNSGPKGTPQPMTHWTSAKTLIQSTLKAGKILIFSASQSCAFLGFKQPAGMKVDQETNPFGGRRLLSETVQSFAEELLVEDKLRRIKRRKGRRLLDEAQSGYGKSITCHVPKPPSPAELAKPIVQGVLNKVVPRIVKTLMKEVHPRVKAYKDLLVPMFLKKITEKINLPAVDPKQPWTLWAGIQDMCWVARNDLIRGGIKFDNVFKKINFAKYNKTKEWHRTKTFLTDVDMKSVDGTPGQAQKYQLIVTRKNGWSTSAGKPSVCQMRLGLIMGMCTGCCCKDKTGNGRISFMRNSATMINPDGSRGRAVICSKRRQDGTAIPLIQATKDGLHQNCVEDQCETFFILADFLWQVGTKAIMTLQLIAGQGGMVRPDAIPMQISGCKRCIDADPKDWGNTQCAAWPKGAGALSPEKKAALAKQRHRGDAFKAEDGPQTKERKASILDP